MLNPNTTEESNKSDKNNLTNRTKQKRKSGKRTNDLLNDKGVFIPAPNNFQEKLL